MAQLDREYLKETYPNLYKYLLGGEKADEYTSNNNKSRVTVENIAKGAGGVVSTGFDIVVWLKDNWQIAIVGIVALLVILRD